MRESKGGKTKNQYLFNLLAIFLRLINLQGLFCVRVNVIKCI